MPKEIDLTVGSMALSAEQERAAISRRTFAIDDILAEARKLGVMP